MFIWIDGLLYKYIEQYLGISIPGLGLIIVLFTITLIGFLGTSFLFKPLAYHFDRLMSRTPFIKIIYTSVKDLIAAFVGQKRRFNQPVLVKVSADGSIEKLVLSPTKISPTLGSPKRKLLFIFRTRMHGRAICLLFRQIMSPE